MQAYCDGSRNDERGSCMSRRTRTKLTMAPGGNGELPLINGVSILACPNLGGYAVGDNGTVWSPFTRSSWRASGWWPVSQYRRPYGAGYMVVCLRADNGKGKVIQRYVHRLVLEALVGPAPEGDRVEVRHLDGDPTNNRLANLKWGTNLENALDRIRHGSHASGSEFKSSVLDKDKVIAAFLLRSAGKNMATIADLFGVNAGTISDIFAGRSYRVESDAILGLYADLESKGLIGPK
jgi:HNH endonuclease